MSTLASGGSSVSGADKQAPLKPGESVDVMPLWWFFFFAALILSRQHSSQPTGNQKQAESFGIV